MVNRLRFLCKHAYNNVICWHWTHGPNMNDIRFLEVQRKCNICDKIYFTYIFNWQDCYKFIDKHKDKEWSSICKPLELEYF